MSVVIHGKAASGGGWCSVHRRATLKRRCIESYLGIQIIPGTFNVEFNYPTSLIVHPTGIPCYNRKSHVVPGTIGGIPVWVSLALPKKWLVLSSVHLRTYLKISDGDIVTIELDGQYVEEIIVGSLADTKIRENSTWMPNRYSNEFRELAEKKLVPPGEVIVSFGCAFGNEVASLAEYFTDHQFLGVDIRQKSLNLARVHCDHLASAEFISTLEFFSRHCQYAAVLVLNVLKRRRRHPYSFKEFCTHLQEISGFVRLGGILCLAGTAHSIEETPIFVDYEQVPLTCGQSGLSADEIWLGYDFRCYRKIKNAYQQQTSV